ncbi:MAG: CoA-binding protein, partial [Thiotrichaceae bacterium]
MHISKHYLTPLFAPRSVAVFGASNTEDSVGYVVFKNLLDNNFQGELYAINPKYDKVQERPCYKTVWDIGKPIDLAVIATPARTVHQLVEMCGQYGVKTAVILSAGFSEIGQQGARLEHKVVETAKRFGMRFLGPNSLGMIRPGARLNATFLKGVAHSGHLALVSQSGSLCAAVLDWAERNDVGFSAIISTGTSADLDFGEVLDYLVSDPQTHGILLYIEGIHHSRSFISGLRAAARIKPVIVLKSGHHEHIAPAIKSHSGAMIGRDDAFDAALQRAGVVRVNTFGQLFAAARTLASRYKAEGNRLAVITNGGGPGVMAIDLAVDLHIPIATLSPETIKTLDK